jgi:hypothetical protein
MKKAKKFLLNLLAFASVSAFALSSFACDNKHVGTGGINNGLGGLGGLGGTTHTHVYDQEIVETKYAKSAATCYSGGIYYKSCTCGEKGTDFFHAGALGHTGDYCTRCKKDVTSKGLEYELSDDGTYYILTGIGECTDSNLFIPSFYNNLPVTRISAGAFSCNEQLTSITIGPGILAIEESAFYLCRNLTKIYYTGSVADWCTIEFENVGSNPIQLKTELYIKGQLLTKLIIPENIETINDYSFEFYSSLKSVTLPRTLKTLKTSAFDNCDNLTTIYYMGDIAQWCNIAKSHSLMTNCEQLYIEIKLVADNLIIPDTVKVITAFSFYGCSQLTNITIPNTITTIETCAFSRCSKLTTITIPKSVTYIGNNAFSSCSSLTNIVFEDTFNWQAADITGNGRKMDVSDSSKNATYFTSEPYRDCHWLKL